MTAVSRTLVYGTKTDLLTDAIKNLASGSFYQSAGVDNSSAALLDYLVGGWIKGGTSPNGYVNLYVAASIDGTNYSGDASGSAGSYSGEYKNLHFLGSVWLDTNNTVCKFGGFSVAAAFGGTIPPKWSLVVENQSAAALYNSDGVHEIHHVGVKDQVA